MIKQIVSLGVASLLVMAAFVVSTGTTANAQVYDNDNNKVTICHRTNAVKNPYRSITVSVNAVDGKGKSDHFGEHKGPLVTSEAEAQALKAKGEKWGDIIPPAAGHEGQNYSTEGRAILENDCKYVKSEPVVLTATASIRTLPATCEVGEKLVYGSVANATFTATSTANGTTGPAAYSVTAAANTNAEFATSTGVSADKKSLTFTGTLDGKLTGSDCVLGEETPPTGQPTTPTPPAVTPTSTPAATPEMLPNTGAGSSLAILGLVAGLLTVTGLGATILRKTLSRGL